MNTLQTFVDLLETLDLQYVIHLGSKDEDGNTVLIANELDASQGRLSDDDTLAVLDYLTTSWMRLVHYVSEEASTNQYSLTLLLDRRDTSWEHIEALISSINTLVDKSSENASAPADISDANGESSSPVRSDLRRFLKHIYVYRLIGLTSLFSASGNQKSIAKLSKIPLTFVNSASQLHSLVALDALPVGQPFYGTYSYSHHLWLKQRNAVESYVQVYRNFLQKVAALEQHWRAERARIERSLRGDAAGDCEYRKVAECAQSLRDEEQRAYALQIAMELFLEDIASLVSNTAVFGPAASPSPENSAISRNGDACAELHVRALEKARRELSAVYTRYRGSWNSHRETLQRVLDLRRFDERAALVTRELEDRIISAVETVRHKALETMRLDELETVLQDLIALQTDATNQDTLERLNELLLFGIDHDQSNSGVEDVTPGEDGDRQAPVAVELQWASRLDRLRQVSDRLHSLLDECERCLGIKQRVLVSVSNLEAWCTRCDELLETLLSAESGGADHQHSQLDAEQIGAFADEYDTLVGAFGGDARRELADVLIPRFATRIQLLVSDAAAHVSRLRAAQRQLEQAALQSDVTPNAAKLTRASNETPNSASFDSGFSTLKRLREKQHLDLSASGDDSIVAERTVNAARDKHLVRCRYIVNELIETERAYVADLEIVVRGYGEAWREDSSLSELLPAAFRSAPDVQFAALFGNLPAVLDFHRENILEPLLAVAHLSSTLGDAEPDGGSVSPLSDVFIGNENLFISLYSAYCQSRSAADRVLLAANAESADSEHAYFRECRSRLQHRLPLNAYLLKPTQRITKYQLLLADLLRSVRAFETAADSGPRCARLLRLCGRAESVEAAHRTMLRVLASINNALHEAMIVACPKTNLASFGSLLQQAGCTVLYKLSTRAHDGKANEQLHPAAAVDVGMIGESLKHHYYTQRTHYRHLFLYEKCVLFCKPVKLDDESQADVAVPTGDTSSRVSITSQQVRYRVKHLLEMSRVGITDSLPSNPKRFELWIPPRERETYAIEMKSVAEKTAWTESINQLLLKQLQLIKLHRFSNNGNGNGNGAATDVQLGPLHACAGECCREQSESTEISRRNLAEGLSAGVSKSSGKGLASKAKQIFKKLGAASSKKTVTKSGHAAPSQAQAASDGVQTQEVGAEAEQKVETTDEVSVDSDTTATSNDPANLDSSASASASHHAKPISLFIALSDYMAVSDREISLTEGDLLQVVVKRQKSAMTDRDDCEDEAADEETEEDAVYNQPTYLYVRKLSSDEYGYVPASYVTRHEPIVDSVAVADQSCQ